MNTAGIIGHTAQIRRLELMLQKKQIPQAMLFTGISGIGKKMVARRFLGTLFCRGADPPCLACSSCRQIASGSYPDLIELAPGEKGKILIGTPEKEEPGSIRWLINRLSKRSLGGYLGVIIDGMETVTAAGQNALLKTLEEPQRGTCIIIITANRSLMLPTIISRCTEISFHPLPESDVAVVMGDAVSKDWESVVAGISGGSVERALLMSKEEMRHSILELCSAITASIVEGSPFDADIARYQKDPGYDLLLDICIGVYRHALRSAIGGVKIEPELDAIARVDEKRTRKLIKIFLALKKGLLNNLNIKMSLKGMLYSIDGMEETGVPDLTA